MRRGIARAAYIVSMISLLFCLVSLLSACGIQSTPEPEGRLVTRAEFGNRWPFTVESGYVDCDGLSRAVFRVGDKTYAINGTARSWASRRGYLDVTPIWRDNPDFPGTGAKVSIDVMISLALQECD